MYGGVNLLMHAAGKCSEEELSTILTQTAPNVNARDKLGRTALHFACRSGNIGAFKALILKEETEVDAVTNAGVTSLMMAIESGSI